ncbi:hypothetical protein SARC_00725 [Sphaeroforma arctica JP610]|uniref:C2H2-type domain-containing protein n=1 Tax=Sphaeroforma arctica JP610 TaxID=667725 RepID=A0A0L0GFT8_9EUKA|nr:hypothetical protein SARC_00725 [Sphaeroforma arctica JP610]KNC87143.1 hypothetical protein SARC_00725 [Sphaeroforma arctica JP610]|eukprot:XP_014161045.1 hypothetical protein SARC_00725 [Sphaeroforma arctica JP610]
MMEKGWVTDVLQRGWVKNKGWVANRAWVTISGSDIADYAAVHVCAWPECGRAFGSEEEYKIHHLLAHHGDAAYQCPICRTDLPHSNALNAHWELHHKDTRHCVCPVPECTKVLVEDETAIIHVLDHADPKGSQRQEYRQMRDQFISSGIAVAFMAYYTGLYNPVACISIMLTYTPGI